MRKKAIAIYMTLIMLGLTACSQTEAANMDLQPESKTAEGNIALTEVNSQDVAHVIHEQHVEQEMNEESGQDGSGDMSEYIEVNPEFEGEPDIYDEAHGFRDDMSDEDGPVIFNMGQEPDEAYDPEGIMDIEATIICERDSHKGIVIGKGGTMLKKIGSAARKDIEELVGCKVNLQLWVKVRRDWRDDKTQLKSFGYDIRNLKD